ncbi:winged helix-turn-helix domain-containing protein [Streptomyces antimycoticus]|uniref:winged helix-turn-helix domain-containing protein n=1 Tax=Streptomyces antimycoticus TaxID=68175 RepID=UPI0036B9D43B
MITGERYAGKLARTVREGAVGKGPEPRACRRPTSLCGSPRVRFPRATRPSKGPVRRLGGQTWTLSRIKTLIRRRFHKSYTVQGVAASRPRRTINQVSTSLKDRT